MIMIMIEIQGRGTTGEPTHTVSKQWHHVPQLYQLLSEKKTLHCWLCSTHYTAATVYKELL